MKILRINPQKLLRVLIKKLVKRKSLNGNKILTFYVKVDSINKKDVRKILDEKINQILEKHFDQWLDKKLPYYIKNYLEKK